MIKKLSIVMLLLVFASLALTESQTLKCLAASNSQPEESPFAGRWSGTWTAKAKNYDADLGEDDMSQTGRWILSIDSSGRVTGKETNNVTNRTADLSGSVNEEGSIKLILEYPNSEAIVKGTIIKTKNGHLKGTLSQSGKNLWTIEIDLLPQ